MGEESKISLEEFYKLFENNISRYEKKILQHLEDCIISPPFQRSKFLPQTKREGKNTLACTLICDDINDIFNNGEKNKN